MAGRVRWWVVIGLGLTVAIVALPVVVALRLHAFDGLYGQDAFAYVGYALGPLRAAILAGQATPEFALPPGYPLLVALASLVLGPSDVVATGVSLAAGASIPPLVGLLVLELWPAADRRIAILAALVAAVTGQLWQSSAVAMADTPALAAATLGAVATCRFHRTGRARWLLVGAAALAFAIEIRLVYGAVALAFAGLAIARLRSDPRLSRGAKVVLGDAAALVALLVLSPMLWPMVAAAASGAHVPFTVELGVAPFDPSTPIRSAFETADGRLEYGLPMAAWLALQPLQPYWLGALGLVVPVGVLDVLRSRPRRAVELAVLVAWPGLMALVLVFYPYQNPRFVLGLLPPLAVLVACGVAGLWTRLERRPVARGVLAVAVAILIVANGALAWRHVDAFTARQAADLAAIRQLAAEIPAGASVVSLGATATLRHDGLDVTELFGLGLPQADAITAGGPTYVLVGADAMTGQWAGTPTGLAFDHLRRAPRFAEVDRAGAWTLFAIRP